MTDRTALDDRCPNGRIFDGRMHRCTKPSGHFTRCEWGDEPEAFTSKERLSDIDLRELIRAYDNLGETTPAYNLPVFYDEVVQALKELQEQRSARETEARRFVKVDTDDGEMTVETCPRCAYPGAPEPKVGDEVWSGDDEVFPEYRDLLEFVADVSEGDDSVAKRAQAILGTAPVKDATEPKQCVHRRSELLGEKQKDGEPLFQMRKCLDCRLIFRVRSSLKSSAPRCSECGDSGTVIDTEGREYDCYACSKGLPDRIMKEPR